MRELSDSHFRDRLERSGRLHWYHWVAVAMSLALTLVAWRVADKHVQERAQRQFDREAAQVIDLIRERMQKYEDALWAGVALFGSSHEITLDEWRTYSETIRLDVKYPGINGIGFIAVVEPDALAAFVETQRVARPDFTVYPAHDEDVAFPIVFIEPVEANRAAVGLDIAHESNRLRAALKARDTGEAQITGPIVLVQDSARTPGFLFYAPVYEHADPDAGERRFRGMVYAPFVVRHLMEGVLRKENRPLGVRLSDGADRLYDELVEGAPDFDADPRFARTETVEMYGRTWRFDVHSGLSFRAAQSSTQPQLILWGGLLIEGLLIALFLLLSHANRRALALVDLATQELQHRNTELERFVYTASHDLKSPLVTIHGFTGIMRSDLEAGRHDRLWQSTDRIAEGVRRMQANVDDLLELSKIGRVVKDPQAVDLARAYSDALEQVAPGFSQSEGAVVIEPDLPSVDCDPDRLMQVLENLITNAVRYGRVEGRPFRLTLGARDTGRAVEVVVSDNGEGVPDAYREKVFGLFERLRNDGGGTGVGLAIVRRIAEVHGGRAWVEDTPGGGATFVVSFPRAARQVAPRRAA